MNTFWYKASLSLAYLVVLHCQLGLAVVAAHSAHRNVRQSLDQRRILGKERLLGDARHLAVYCFAGQRVHHLDVLAAHHPVDAEVGRLDLVARLRRRDQRELRLVEDVRGRQTLDDRLDAAADGAGG